MRFESVVTRISGSSLVLDILRALANLLQLILAYVTCGIYSSGITLSDCLPRAASGWGWGWGWATLLLQGAG
jgi:hypothetical protein